MAQVLHVSPNGNDINDGTAANPLRTIGAAAAIAMPGDTVRISAGIYRERVDPPRGGTAADNPIVYEAAAGENVVLTGSDVFTNWQQLAPGLWQLIIPSSYFSDFNPYAEIIHGDWFAGHGRIHRRGNVFLDGAWLPEAQTVFALESGTGIAWSSTVDGLVERPKAEAYGVEGRGAFAPAEYDADGNTTIFVRLPEDIDPNAGRVEVSVRSTVFTPTAEHIDFITLRGFEIRNAATNWVAPTSGQEGMVTPYWSRGWVIENNEICYSRCTGIALAKNRDEYDGERGTTDGYYSTIADALERDGWSKETIGSHIVRNNRIHHCGQAAIIGSLGCAFSIIEDNEIHDCNLQGIWGGAEMAGIKLHGAIDTLIRGNHVYRCGASAGIWLDWMAQGTQVTHNLLHDNLWDILTEVNHGPILIANNVMLSRKSIETSSQGLAIVHNLIMGEIKVQNDDRETPILEPHSTKVVEWRQICSAGDLNWSNNILGESVNLKECDKAAPELPCTIIDNVRLVPEGSSPVIGDPAPWLESRGSEWWMGVSSLPEWNGIADCISTQSLGEALVPQQRYINPDGTSFIIDNDYFGNRRKTRVSPGPFEPISVGMVQVWPVQRGK